MQTSSYLGVWGRVFEEPAVPKNGTTHGNTTTAPAAAATGTAVAAAANSTTIGSGAAGLAERIQGWRTEAEEARSRLIQRISGKSGPRNTLEKDPLSEVAKLLFGGSLSTISSPPSSSASIATKSIATEAFGMLEKLQERLGLDGTLDAKQLAALALVQGLAVSAFTKHASASSSVRSADAATGGGEDDGGGDAPFSTVGVLLPDTVAANHFESDWCMRMQNLGNSDGYRTAYLGATPCHAENNTWAQEEFQWGDESAFTLDCTSKTPESSSSVANTGAAAGGVAGMFRAAAANAASELSAAMQRTTTMECRLSITSSSGAGALLQHAQALPMFGLRARKLNAMKLRVCNVPPSLLQFPAALGKSDASIFLHSLKLNGRKLAVGGGALPFSQASLDQHRHDWMEARQALAQSGGRECEVVLLRVPSRAVSSGFVLNGALELKKEMGVWGVGEMASVEIQVGSIKLLPNTAE